MRLRTAAGFVMNSAAAGQRWLGPVTGFVRGEAAKRSCLVQPGKLIFGC